MKITELPAYKRLIQKFEDGIFKHGIKCDLKFQKCEELKKSSENTYKSPHRGHQPEKYHSSKNMVPLTPGHYAYALFFDHLSFTDVPESYRTREVVLCTLSGCRNCIIEYVKKHLGTKFDREFFKDHIATATYALEFENNCFSYMPLEYIDEEMVYEAMYHAIKNRYTNRRNDFDDWFYSVVERKPEVLNQDIWILAARCFAFRNRDGRNKILELTPKQYKTYEYYFAMCLSCDTPVMEDFPKEILTTEFLKAIISDDANNITAFSAEALEKTVQSNENKELKFWQLAILLNGRVVGSIPFNDERVEFFLKNYDKDSVEYRLGFQEQYKMYKKRNSKKKPSNNNDALKPAEFALEIAMATGSVDTALDVVSCAVRFSTNRKARLPIEYVGRVPKEYCKVYDQQEYLLEIYKKLGIEVIDECDDGFFYSVVLPEGISIESADNGYHLNDDNGTKLLTYYDRGPFYDRDVKVKELFITL